MIFSIAGYKNIRAEKELETHIKDYSDVIILDCNELKTIYDHNLFKTSKVISMRNNLLHRIRLKNLDLDFINLSFNKFKSVPTCLNKIKIATLILNNNKIKKVKITNNVKHLQINNNKIKYIKFEPYSNLEILSAGNNLLKRI